MKPFKSCNAGEEVTFWENCPWRRKRAKPGMRKWWKRHYWKRFRVALRSRKEEGHEL